MTYIKQPTNGSVCLSIYLHAAGWRAMLWVRFHQEEDMDSTIPITSVDFDRALPPVVLIDELEKSCAYLPSPALARAVVPFPKKQRAEQPDNTTPVCHPL